MFYSQIIYTLPPGDLLEIGIGTNNPDLQSTMGKSGRPGASLFAWQESHMFQKVFGADIDKEILFNHEVGIKTFYVDQTNVFDLSMLKENLAASRISIIIDDGLHEPQANMTAFQELWEIVLPGGVYCIEDVKQSDLLPLIIELAPYLQEFEWSIYQNFHRKIDNSIICIRKIYRDKS
jgi:SAM-dependent methyltransferase